MDLQLEGKRAIILGATRGIGRATAELLAEEGASVAICARNAAQVKETVAALTARGGKAIGEVVDIAQGAALKAFVSRVAETFGGLDIVISNASAMSLGSTREEWLALLDIDLLGLMNLVDAALPHLEEAASTRGDAAIIAISSASAVIANRPEAYGAVKGALIHLVKGYARALARKQIRANVVSPGTIYLANGFWGQMERERPEVFKRSLEHNPLGRMGTPQEIAAATVFLASPRSSFTTGANLRVDGAITEDVNY
ncbi:MAG: SDR family oxidoreductase [Alphaproteobacteria bacterium]